MQVNDVTMVMHKNLVLSGSVIDANTKKPVERFSIVHAIKYPQSSDWYFQNDISHLQTAVVQVNPPVPLNPDGRFERTWGAQFESMFLRIKAPGYDVADSQAFRMGEEKLTFHFELTPNPNITGTVSFSDGTPAVGAEIAVGSKGNPVYLFNGRIDRKRTPVVVTADREGKFSFPAVDGQYTLVAMHDSGNMITRGEVFDIDRKIKLTAFADTKNMASYSGGKITTLTFGKGGQEPLDGYFIDIAYDPQQDATAKSRIINVFFNRADGQTSLYVPLR